MKKNINEGMDKGGINRNGPSTPRPSAPPPPQPPDPRYKIINLTADNIKRIEAVDITPTEDLVLVAGNNDQGKTSVLDAIAYALGGKDMIPEEPIKAGAHKAKVVVNCGEFVVTRVITDKTQQLVIKRKDGTSIEQPQTFLDSIIGKLAFDPLEFAKMKDSKRVDTLFSLTDGLKERLQEIDRQYQKLYDERRDVNVGTRNLSGQLADMETPSDTWPRDEVDIDEIIAERDRLQAVIDTNNEKRKSLKSMSEKLSDLDLEIEELKSRLKAMKEKRESLADTIALRTKEVDGLRDPDLSKLNDKLRATIEGNKLAQKRKRYQEVVNKRSENEEISRQYTERLEEMDQARRDLLASVRLPVSGLTFDSNEVRFDGCLFDQLSSAKKLRVSVAMAMAMNPRMRVIRITDGSLLDPENMDVLREMARENGFQIWVECVGERDDATVIIEDGRVKQG